MLKVGITGGIGSGKSVVSKIFKVLGIPVLDADNFTKELMNNNTEVKSSLIAAFGNEIFVDGTLNRTLLASIVFGNPDKLEILNNITHPAVRKYSSLWMMQQNSKYVIKEAALFFESGSHIDMDVMIGVSAPFDLRLSRAMARDKVDKDTILKRMASQMDEEEKMSRCDFIIINDGKQSLIKQVLKIHEEILQLTKQNY
ncbi:MAG TPA: dephospho-CoA kinase [Edaphocola sp.]|nr:dephospho-CoA kinase [Edaphocola sp.]